GFEYVGAVPQKNGQTSFKKRQHPFSVLSGQLMINFRKTKSPRAIMKANLGTQLTDIIIQTIEGIIAQHGRATLEQINDELIVRGLELGFLDLLAKKYNDLTPFLLQNFRYNEDDKTYSIAESRGFKSHLDVRLRIRYYLIPYLNRCEREGQDARFDEIVRSIMPLLKNGKTPEEQTILNVLEDIAERHGKDSWRLKLDVPQLFR
ncbi:MAG: hypothetical protein FWE67_13355, partial [Planctomycetaceae bacterium]|nr:hypothetical protein [Planctomycetaceae bacterium]